MIASAVNSAIKIAKANLGDLLREHTLKKASGKTYDTATGRYTTTYVDLTVEGVPDKFSFQEMQAEDFVQTDVKMIIFNDDNNSLTITTDDALLMDGVQYAIRKVDPVFVGGFKPMFQLALRK